MRRSWKFVGVVALAFALVAMPYIGARTVADILFWTVVAWFVARWFVRSHGPFSRARVGARR
ncbi:hypothetical protein NONI108955_41945 [Nocardia ninae]|uniref:Uncharacterized protein n=1 Tax=Nocardia ninae NBRC 108245 TaxID=1210091 RepID=A0A511MT29_9NOCA|nr:hypothetical protein NN4_82490 [Nocardia ninae NBRC 108245]